jgi:hypothetical protein
MVVCWAKTKFVRNKNLPVGKSGNPSALGAEDREFESLQVDQFLWVKCYGSTAVSKTAGGSSTLPTFAIYKRVTYV